MKSSRRVDAKTCQLCQAHRALYRGAGGMRYHPSHPLCRRCWRSLHDQTLASQLASCLAADAY